MFGNRRVVVTVAVVAIATMGLVEACTSGSSKTGGASGDTITIWEDYGAPSSKASNPGLTNLQKKNAAYMKAHPGVKFSIVDVPFADLDNKLIASAQTQTGPDLILNSDGQDVEQLVQAGAIADMTKDVQGWTNVKQITPDAYEKVNGKIYGVLPYLNLIGLWYNKDILDEAGVAPPRTFDELQTDLAAVTARGHKGIVFAADPNWEGAWTSRPLFTAMGVNYPKVQYASLTRAVSTLSGWVKKGWAPTDNANFTQGDAANAFVTGRYAFMINGNWNSPLMKSSAKFKYGAEPFPSGAGKALVYTSGEVAMLGAFSTHASQVSDYLNTEWYSRQGALDSYTINGSLPVLNPLFNSPQVQNDPIAKPFAEAVESASTPSVLGPAYTFANGTWGPAFSTIFAGKDPQAISSQLFSNYQNAKLN